MVVRTINDYLDGCSYNKPLIGWLFVQLTIDWMLVRTIND